VQIVVCIFFILCFFIDWKYQSVYNEIDYKVVNEVFIGGINMSKEVPRVVSVEMMPDFTMKIVYDDGTIECTKSLFNHIDIK
jgi:hypothetical protein